jgi:hypothetical protein
MEYLNWASQNPWMTVFILYFLIQGLGNILITLIREKQ